MVLLCWIAKLKRLLNFRLALAGITLIVCIAYIGSLGYFKALMKLQPGIMYNKDFKHRKYFDSQHNAEINKVRHVAFLKVHKTASTTVQNIFLRFGWHRNLTFVLPAPPYTWGLPNIISLYDTIRPTNVVRPPPGRHYDILCNHVLYSYQSFRDTMPNDTVFIGIVREPFEQFISSISFLKPGYILNIANSSHPVDTFLENPRKHEPRNPIRSWTNNRMALEFGFPLKLFDKYDMEEVAMYLRRLDKEFQLVLVTELIDESCILMRRLLNWQTQDILHINLNKGTKLKKAQTTLPNGKSLYRQHARIDFDLYNFFLGKLLQRISKEGDDFEGEVVQFKDTKRIVTSYCRGNATEELYIPQNDWNGPFTVTKDMCNHMKRDEIKFVQKIRKRQYTRFIPKNATAVLIR